MSVPIRCKQQVQKLVNINGNQYVFTVRHNISLAYVTDSDVPGVLAIKKNCCVNRGGPLFKLASAAEERVWREGGRM
jgi:hypothetical protein